MRLASRFSTPWFLSSGRRAVQYRTMPKNRGPWVKHTIANPGTSTYSLCDLRLFVPDSKMNASFRSGAHCRPNKRGREGAVGLCREHDGRLSEAADRPVLPCGNWEGNNDMASIRCHQWIILIKSCKKAEKEIYWVTRKAEVSILSGKDLKEESEGPGGRASSMLVKWLNLFEPVSP